MASEEAKVATPSAAPDVVAATPDTASQVAKTPLMGLTERLPAILEKTGHNEMWGVSLLDATKVPAIVVLQKFLRANNSNVDLAEKQLTAALEWRKKTNPGALLDSMAFDKKKFDGVGYVTVHKTEDGRDIVITWNIYGVVKDFKATFGNVEEFVKWRAALMELGLRKLNLNEVAKPIPEGGEDPYQMIQVHDYLNVSFLRLDPHVKAASKETIQTFSVAYPELLSHKYFVNVPAIMGWVFTVMKLILSPATVRKFHPMSSGSSLGAEIKGVSLPKEYGGSGPSVKEGLTVQLADVDEKPPAGPEAVPTNPVPETPAAVEQVPKQEKESTTATPVAATAAATTT